MLPNWTQWDFSFVKLLSVPCSNLEHDSDTVFPVFQDSVELHFNYGMTRNIKCFHGWQFHVLNYGINIINVVLESEKYKETSSYPI